MGLFRKGKPSVRALARSEDIATLVDAARFRDLTPGRDAGTVDLGVPVREEAILRLGALGTPGAAPVVEAALTDPSDRVRTAAVRVLHARRAAGPLAAALTRLGHGRARRLALRALAELGRPDSAAPLAAALLRAPGEAPVADDEAAVLLALLAAGDKAEAASDAVEQVMAAGDKAEAASDAIEQVMAAGDKAEAASDAIEYVPAAGESAKSTGDAVEELLAGLADEREAVAERAEDLLVLVAPRSIPGLIAALKAGAGAHRAASALGRIRDTEALGQLMDALQHRDPRVRAESATALGELRDPAAVEALIHATRDSEHRVRAQAGWALDRLGTVAVVVGVSTLVRPMIQEALAAPEERPALNPASHDRTHDGPASGDPVTVPAMPLVLEPSLAGFEDRSCADEEIL